MVETNFTITDEEFSRFKTLVYELMGISLNETKKMLLISRLSKRLRVLGLAQFRDYYDYITRGDHQEEMVIFMNLITTNKTDFFREEHHFHQLSGRILPERLQLLEKGQIKNIRIWSAGCSTGEEPYTIAMTILEALGPRHNLDIKILATDIDTNVLATAQEGLYKHEKITEIPDALVSKYFTAKKDGNYLANDSLKNLIKFGQLNLMHDFPFKYGFDMIFCRNVLIYFTPEDRKAIVKKFLGNIRPDGYLALGHSESMVTEGMGLKTIGPTLYKKVAT